MTRTAALIAVAFVAVGLPAQAAFTSETPAATGPAPVLLAMDPGPDWGLMRRGWKDSDTCSRPEDCEELALRALR